MNSSVKTNHSLIRKQLNFAQHKLLSTNIPLQLRATSFIRICCSAMQAYHTLTSGPPSIYPKYWNANTPYLHLLKLLADENSQWWMTCTVSYEGLLESSNPVIRQLLHPLNTFVQAPFNLLAA